MSNIKGKNTTPELIVRKFLFSKGLRFRLHKKNLAGKPDIVLTKYKVVIFINGCFWHGHDNCRYYRLPKSNIDYWDSKIKRNKNRDIVNIEKLQNEGWKVIIVWECEIKNALTSQKRLERLYSSIIGSNPYKSGETEESILPLAADPNGQYD